MTHFFAAPPPSSPASPSAGHTLIRWICTSNPFYAVSAALFLGGLRLSFSTQGGEIEAWSLMGGLAGYTLLLALTAWLLIRFGKVWDDARTVLLLVVLMFLATSVTFDEVVVFNPTLGAVCCLIGLGLAVGISEALLWGTGLRLPACFRLPYHLLLALYFLYPLLLSPHTAQPHSEVLLWGLFGFSTAAGLIFLTLLPAARLGPRSVRVTGGPWQWPLYPWVLLGVLGAAVPARAFLLCWSMHLPEAGSLDQLVFGPYFLVPFGFAGAVVLLEAGLGGAYPRVQRVALVIPLGLVALSVAGHRPDPVYQEFLGLFLARLGATPLFLTLTAALAFYLYAALRRTAGALGLMTAALAVLAVVGPETLDLTGLVMPRPLPILTAGLLQLALGWRHGEALRCLGGGWALALATALAVPTPGPALALGFHLAVGVVLLVGAVFKDDLARTLRIGAAVMLLVAAVGTMFGSTEAPAGLPGWSLLAYPLLVAAVLLGYGLLLRQRTVQIVAALVLCCWLGAEGWDFYAWARRGVAGLDYLMLSLALFAVAVLISLGKSGVLRRLLAPWLETEPALQVATQEGESGT